MLFIYTTCATEAEAENLGKLIINNKMGACVDYWPVKSIYEWKGEFKEVPQVMLTSSHFIINNKLTQVFSLGLCSTGCVYKQHKIQNFQLL
jgi:uncharacterized protein involved in tolerance to divalent cations